MSTKTKAKEPKADYSVAVPESVWVVVGARGGITAYKDATRASAKWAALQALRDDQVARGHDAGTDPMLVEYVPQIASARTKRRQ